jgi:Fe-S cluster biogenesis protein NfuA
MIDSYRPRPGAHEVIAKSDVSAVWDTLRVLVDGDGADLELLDVEPATGTVRVRLCLEGVSCLECVMPRAMLEEIATSMLSQKVPGVMKVRIEDPREPAPLDTTTIRS